MTFSRTKTNGIIRGGPSPTLTGNGRPRSAAQVIAEDGVLPIFLESLPASYQVQLSFEARRSIERECRAMFIDSGGDMCESGGWLFAHPGRENHITMATTPGADAVYGRSSIELGSERLNAVRAQLPHMRVVGSWHLHSSDDGVPSLADRKAWASWRELDDVDYHTGLIVTCRSGGWVNLEYHGWLTTTEFTERLRVVQL
jgi:hypothetical protein